MSYPNRMLKILRFSPILVTSLLLIFINIPFFLSAETTSSNDENESEESRGSSPRPKKMVEQNPRCNPIKERIEALLGEGHVDCYINLFMKESSCKHKLQQKQGNTGNPAAGFGLCTLETSPAKRNKRGSNCRAATPENIDKQILCCRDIMRAFSVEGSYYGPVRRRETPKCN